MSEETYIVINKMQIQRANMMQTPYLYAPTPVFACVMMAHALGKKINAETTGVGIVHHNADPLFDYLTDNKNGKIESSPAQFKCASWVCSPLKKGLLKDYANKNNPNGISIQPTMTAHLDLSLLIRVELGGDDDLSLNDIKKHLRRMRIAGGLIISFNGPYIKDNLSESLKKMPSGYWIEDAMDLVRERRKNGYNLIESIFLSQDNEWLVPACLGYNVISDFKYREGTRMLGDKKLKNAFADNLLGLIKYNRTSNIVSKINDEDFDIKLWKHQFKNNYFIVNQ